MSAETRELIFQLLATAASAALIVLLLLRVRRRLAGTARVAVIGVVIVALAWLGPVESRIIAAVVTGAGLGVVIAGLATLVRSRRTASSSSTAMRALALIAVAVISVLPLLALGKRSAGSSVLGITRSAAEQSGGSWGNAWMRAWLLILDPDHLQLRGSLVIAWTLLVVVALAIIAVVAARVVVWGRAVLPAAHPASSIPVVSPEPSSAASASLSGMPIGRDASRI